MSEHPARDDLLAYHGALLEAEQNMAVEKHVAGCSECQQVLQAMAGREAGRFERAAKITAVE